MYRTLLEEIANEHKRYGLTMQPPCSQELLMSLKDRCRRELAHDLPGEYCTFLEYTDGLDWNGLMLYASIRRPLAQSPDSYIWEFVESNLLHRERPRLGKFLVFGHSGVDLYVYNIDASDYQVIDQVSLDLTESFPSFEQLITEALKSHL